MRLREKTWEYYGIDKMTKGRLITEMREEPERVDEMIERCKVPCGIKKNVREWILKGTSYQKQNQCGYVPISDTDFYGWCRKVVVGYFYASNGGNK